MFTLTLASSPCLMGLCVEPADGLRDAHKIIQITLNLLIHVKTNSSYTFNLIFGLITVIT